MSNFKCCNILQYHATHKNNLIKYEPHVREYNFILYNDADGDYLPLYYCPWCGTKQPKKLSKEWCTVLEKELGLNGEDIFAEEWKKLPHEFRSDKWWKKRGL